MLLAVATALLLQSGPSAAFVLRGHSSSLLFQSPATANGTMEGNGVRHISTSSSPSTLALANRSLNLAAAATVPQQVPGSAVNFTATSGAQQGHAGTRGPRIYFLMLAVNGISNFDIWKAFFANAPREQYRAFVHCKTTTCRDQVLGSAFTLVPTVPNYYCSDLVSPMQELVATALQDFDGLPNQYDKFAFISDSSLPAKPFSVVYQTLSARSGSDFCAFPSAEWADSPGSSLFRFEYAVKHHQWITMNRAHAARTWELWASGTLHNFMTQYRMNVYAQQSHSNIFGDHRNYGCLDEFWYMLSLYGPLHAPDNQHAQDVHLSMFTGGSLRVSPDAGWQGECDTFVMWAKYMHSPGWNPFFDLYSKLDSASTPNPGDTSRPGWWDQMSSVGMRAVRESHFLFIRKFIDNPRMVDGPNFAAAWISNVL